MSDAIDSLQLDKRSRELLHMLHEVTNSWNYLGEFDYSPVLGGKGAKGDLDEAFSVLVRAIERELGYSLHGALKDTIHRKNNVEDTQP